MDCERSAGLMMDFMDNSLDEKEESWLQKHINVCEECRCEFQMWTDIKNGIQKLDLLFPGDDFQQKVMDSIDLGLYTKDMNSSLLWKLALICVGIYMCILSGLYWSTDVPYYTSQDIVQFFHSFIAFSSFIERIVFKYFMLLLAPQNLIQHLFQQISARGLLIYGAGILNLIIIFCMMQLVFFKIPKEKRGNTR